MRIPADSLDDILGTVIVPIEQNSSWQNRFYFDPLDEFLPEIMICEEVCSAFQSLSWVLAIIAPTSDKVYAELIERTRPLRYSFGPLGWQ